MISVIKNFQGGTDSLERLEILWQIPVLRLHAVVVQQQAGSKEYIQQWLMELFNAKYASVGKMYAVGGQPTSMYATAGAFTFTNLVPHLFVMLVTVATDNHLRYEYMEL